MPSVLLLRISMIIPCLGHGWFLLHFLIGAKKLFFAMAGPDAKKLKLGGLHVYVFQAKLFEVEGTFKETQ